MGNYRNESECKTACNILLHQNNNNPEPVGAAAALDIHSLGSCRKHFELCV